MNKQSSKILRNWCQFDVWGVTFSHYATSLTELRFLVMSGRVDTPVRGVGYLGDFSLEKFILARKAASVSKIPPIVAHNKRQ